MVPRQQPTRWAACFAMAHTPRTLRLGGSMNRGAMSGKRAASCGICVCSIHGVAGVVMDGVG
jgi:hypothetical protein